MEINKRLLESTIENWKNNCGNIMDSQRRYNEEAMIWSVQRVEKLISELDK